MASKAGNLGATAPIMMTAAATCCICNTGLCDVFPGPPVTRLSESPLEESRLVGETKRFGR
jgi:hypothetical protein